MVNDMKSNTKNIIVKNGKFTIPKQHELTETKRRLTIKMAWSIQVQRLNKFGQVSIMQWFRQKGKDKPYIPEGFIDIDNKRYKVIHK